VDDEALALTLADLAGSSAARADEASIAAAARRTLLDWCGAAIGGSAHPLLASLHEAYSDASGTARVVGGRRALRVSAETAALLNGTAAHVLEVDDIYAPGLYHPGAPTIAAALAVADESNSSGARLLSAIVAGVEIGCRVAADLGPEHYRRWHTTGTAGTIGAAVAAAIVWGADRDRIAHAIAIAGTMAAGVQQTFRTDGSAKPLHAGHAAQAGVVAARTAMAGATGALDVLDGAAGLARATGGGTQWRSCRSGLHPVALVEQLTVKPFPCCGHTFAAIGAALELHGLGIDLDAVEDIRVETYTTATETAGIDHPASGTEARFSIRYVTASALVNGRITASSFEPDGMREPRVRAAMSKIRVVATERFDLAFPHRRGAAVTVRQVDGTTDCATVPDRHGSPENPIDQPSLISKFADLTAAVLGQDSAAALLRAVNGIQTLPSTHDLVLTH
jgi:2-methylcitrate dehydratase PrpD